MERSFFFNYDTLTLEQFNTQNWCKESLNKRIQTFFSEDLCEAYKKIDEILGFESEEKIYWRFGIKIGARLAKNGFMHLNDNKISCPECSFSTHVTLMSIIMDIEKEFQSIDKSHKNNSPQCRFHHALN